MTEVRVRRIPVVLFAAVALAAAAVVLWLVLGSYHPTVRGSDAGGVLELDVKSAFSRIKITKQGTTRTLWFVRDNGDEVVESMVDIKKPHDLIVEYTQYMFASYFFRPKQEKVLIIGLGGGAMIHFMKQYDPKTKVDVVEIDPKIVEIADKFFGVRGDGNVKIITKDAFDFLKETDGKYDVIYMDAFLKPSADTDPNGVPLHLKTIKFYQDTQKKLTPDGLLVFNLNGHDKIAEDIKLIRDAFPQAYVFDLSHDSGNIVVGAMSPKRMPADAIMDAAGVVDGRFRTSFSFRDIAKKLSKKQNDN